MSDYGQQPYHFPLDWNMQLHSLANDVTFRNYRKNLSRVSKPSSAGNSPHSQTRRRTMTTTYNSNNNGFNQVLHLRNLLHMNNNINTTTQQRLSRPTSWHPSVKQQQQPYYVPNCHPSWLRGDDISVPAVSAQQQQQHQQSGMTSMYGLSTPITCPMSGDLLSTNDYFATTHGEPYDFPAPGPQVYTPIEPSDMLYSEPSEWSTYSMEGTPVSTYPWMQHSNGFVSSTDPAMMEFGHESVASADDLTAPPTPDMGYNHQQQQPTLISTTQDDLDDGGDDLVAVGLYDEPSSLSFSLLSGGDNTCHRTGKGLKLEETFTPADDEDEDGDAENDD